MFDVPIALVIFNRPNVTRALVNLLRDLRPSRVFAIADGPRAHRDGESDKVAQTRAAIDEIDWPCKVTRIFSDDNLGCGRRIRSGISQAFRETEKLIVLEDDCHPNRTFFKLTDQLLDRFEADPRVMAVSGSCFHDRVPETSSYYFSRYAHCWGWATWRRAWNLYDTVDCDWRSLCASPRYASLFDNKRQMAYWTQLFDKSAQGRLDSWAVPWMLACWLNNGLTATPTKNLVTNVGFTEEATHTNFDSPLASRPTFEMHDLHHCETVRRDAAADLESDRLLFSGQWRSPGIIKSTIDVFRRRYGECQSIDPRKKVA